MITAFKLVFNKDARARYDDVKGRVLEYGRAIHLTDTEILASLNGRPAYRGMTVVEAIARNAPCDDEDLVAQGKKFVEDAEFMKAAPNRIRAALITQVCALADEWNRKGKTVGYEAIAAALCAPDHQSLRGDSPVNFVGKNEQWLESRLAIAVDVCDDRLRHFVDLRQLPEFTQGVDDAAQVQAELIGQAFQERNCLGNKDMISDKVVAQALTSRRIRAINGECLLDYCQPAGRQLRDGIHLVSMVLRDYTGTDYKRLVGDRPMPDDFDERREFLSGLVRQASVRFQPIACHA